VNKRLAYEDKSRSLTTIPRRFHIGPLMQPGRGLGSGRQRKRARATLQMEGEFKVYFTPGVHPMTSAGW
jgi:hypothetical protein